MTLKLTPKALEYLRSRQIEAITVDIESYGASLPVAAATVTEAKPDSQFAYYTEYELAGIKVYVFEHMEFRGNVLTIDLKRQLFGKKILTAGELKLT